MHPVDVMVAAGIPLIVLVVVCGLLGAIYQIIFLN